MKKTAALLFTLILVCTLFPPISYAAGNTTITVGGTYYLDDYGDNSTIYIQTTQAVILSQRDPERTFNNIVINCMDCETDLTIDGLQIQNDDLAPISFINQTCLITLSGTSTLLSEGEYPAVRVSADANLTIKGDGSLFATGGENSAGIGGGKSEMNGIIYIDGDVYIEATGGHYGTGIGSGSGISSGFIKITSGTIVARGGYCGAGIGGCSPQGINPDSGRTILIEGGNIHATGGYFQPGIGGYDTAVNISGGTVEAHGTDGGSGIGTTVDYGYHSGSVSISGGTVTAYGSTIKLLNNYYSGAGIGGSDGYATEIVTITGGTVKAYGGLYAAGIGSGASSSNSGKIYIYGGTVFASGNDLADDIGDGADNSEESSFTLGGDYTKVFLEYDRICDINTSYVHMPLIYVDQNNYAYGYKVPDDWNTASLYIARLYSITYNANEALGPVPSTQEVIPGGYATIPGQGSLTYEGLYFSGWNLNPNGAKDMLYPGDLCQINGDAELFAIWTSNPASITLNADSLALNVGGFADISATTENPDPDNHVIYWTTSDPKVAGVSQSGRVFGVGVGNATITAYLSGKSACCTIKVSADSVTAVNLNYGSKSLYVDDVFALSAIVLPDDAPDKSVTWKTSDSGVATVTNSGLVTAKGVGTCTITATADGISDSCAVSVSIEPTPTPAPPIGVSSVHMMLETDFTAVLYVGDTLNLSAAVLPSNAENQSLTWKSSDTSVLTVTSYGLVKALSEGEATVTVTAGGASDSYSITVKDMGEVTSPTLAPTSTGTVPTPPPSDGDVMLNFNIDTQNLPYGAEYILLPDGEVMPLSDKSTMTVCVNQCHLNDGVLQITALDADKNALGEVEVSADKSGINVILIVLIALGILLSGIGGTLAVLKIVINRK